MGGPAVVGAGLLAEIARHGSVLAVVAHPDDESFGLGAILAALAAAGAEVGVLCMTHGEASTLGAAFELASVRRRELTAAAEHLGVKHVALHGFADGNLAEVAEEALDDVVEAALGDAVTLVVFEPSGVTGHPDHQAATMSAHRVAARSGLAVVEWGVATDVATRLNNEFATTFVALAGDDVIGVQVDRVVQLAAIACHESQARDNPVLARRLELEGSLEWIRWVRPRDRRSIKASLTPTHR